MHKNNPGGSINNQDNSRCQLLVSVRDCREAELCMSHKVDWIDLKEPSSGSLGMPSLQVARQVASTLQGHPRRSVALGELADLLQEKTQMDSAWALSQLFPIVKVGLSGMQDSPDWTLQLQAIAKTVSGSLTPVIYADWNRCAAPEPTAIVQWAQENASPYLLIDTFFKEGRRLLDHFTRQQLQSILDQASDAGTKVVLAGSLSLADVPVLIGLPCAALAVRGAVCDGRREGTLCPKRLQEWVQSLTPTERNLQGSHSLAK